MSTRGLFGFVVNGERKASYNHCDSYPSGLGQDTVDVIREVVKKNKLGELREKVAAVKMIKQINSDNDGEEITGVEILPYILSGKISTMIDDYAFFNDTLFCEWAYFINLDTNNFEVYSSGDLLAVFPLTDIPDNWLSVVKSADG